MSQPSSIHIDKVLQDFSLAYLQEQTDFVARDVFTQKPVMQSSGKYYTYTQSYWLTDEMQVRAPGNRYPEAGYELSTDSYVCERWALAHPIADEDREDADEPIDLDQEAAVFLEQKNLIRMERSFATDFMTTSVWGTDDNNSAIDWDSTGTPITNVQTASRTIQAATGKNANAIVMGKIVFDALTTNAQITGLVQYSQRALPRDIMALMGAALDLDYVYVSRAAYDSAAEGVTSSIAPIIDDDALVYFKAPTAPGPRTATAGMLFTWAGGGGLGSFTRVRVDDRDADMARLKAAWDFKKVGASLGYFFADIV